jgi:broad specificity phosphatase PhoE
MMRILLIRHGETAWSPLARLQGGTDVPLSAAGRAQAAAVATALAGTGLDALYASPLSRARETAAAVARGRHPPIDVRLDPRLRELGLGAWEGLTQEEARARDPAALEGWLRDPHASAPGGEPAAEAETRLASFAGEVAGSGAGTVAVVGHLLAFQGLLRAFLGVSPACRWPFHLFTGSVSEVQTGGHGASIVYLNRVDHLAAAGLDTKALEGR